MGSWISMVLMALMSLVGPFLPGLFNVNGTVCEEHEHSPTVIVEAGEMPSLAVLDE